jgi:hypothetical protein
MAVKKPNTRTLSLILLCKRYGACRSALTWLRRRKHKTPAAIWNEVRSTEANLMIQSWRDWFLEKAVCPCDGRFLGACDCDYFKNAPWSKVSQRIKQPRRSGMMTIQT